MGLETKFLRLSKQVELLPLEAAGFRVRQPSSGKNQTEMVPTLLSPVRNDRNSAGLVVKALVGTR
jgi:hypothetical protein